MENRIQSFTNTEFGELEVLQEGDKFWFPATKCAKILGYANPNDAILKHCRGDGIAKREAVSRTTNQHGVTTAQTNEINYITEGNLYRLICRSKLPGALGFETWVFDTILPSIRRHGAYIVPELLEALNKSEAKRQELLDELNAERQTVRALQISVEKTKPMVSFYEKILHSREAVPVTLIAKDYGISGVRFNQLLKKYGIQYPLGGTWALYQKYAGQGYTHNNVYYTKDGKAKTHMCWTQKGRLFLYEFLKQKGILPRVEMNGKEGWCGESQVRPC